MSMPDAVRAAFRLLQATRGRDIDGLLARAGEELGGQVPAEIVAAQAWLADHLLSVIARERLVEMDVLLEGLFQELAGFVAADTQDDIDKFLRGEPDG